MDKDPRLEIEETEDDTALEIARQKTRAYARSLWDIVSRYARLNTAQEKRETPARQIERFQYRRKGLLRFLSLIPYLLFIMFGLSFFWDFQDLQWQAMGLSLQFEGILRILSVSGLIGYLTNWLAITMLFKPAQKRPLLGQGLIPAQKDRIAFRLAQAVSEDLINPEIIKRKINESGAISHYREQSTRYIKSIIDDPGFRSELKSWVVQYVDEMIANPDIRAALAQKIMLEIEDAVEDKSIEKVALKAYSYVKGQEMQHIIEEALVKVPTSVEKGLNKMDDLLDDLPQKIERHSENIENLVTGLLYRLINQLDVHSLVEDNLRDYDEQRISDIIWNASNEQLHYIQYLGAVLGLVGGFVIWEPLISSLFLGALVLLVLGLDNLLGRIEFE